MSAFRSTVLAALLVASLPSRVAFAGPTCESYFGTTPVRSTVGKEIALRIPVDAVAAEPFTVKWAQLLQAAKSRLSPRDARDLEEWILTNFFVDRPQVAMRSSRDARDIEWMWNNTGGRPIQNFFAAFNKFVVVPTKGTDLISDWKFMHKTLMHYKVKVTDVVERRHSIRDWLVSMVGGNVEGIESDKIGTFRSTNVLFYAEGGKSIDYKQNRFLTPKPKEDQGTPVWYPSIKDVDRFTDIISAKLQADIKSKAGTEEQLTQRFVTELVEWAFNQHSLRLADAKNLTERVAAHVELSHRLVSIHPFANGNGRSTRFLLTVLLASEGLPPASLRDTWDVGLSVEQYTQRVLDGISLSRAFIDDVILRIQSGMNPVESPVLMMPLLPSRIYFDPAQSGVGKQYFPVDPYDFAQFTRQQSSPDVDEAARFRSYMKHVKGWGAFNAKTITPYQQKLIPNEMSDTFFNVDATNPLVWKAKRNAFYGSEEVYRGLSAHDTMTDQQLLSYFTEIQPISLSMKSSGAAAGSRVDSIKADFARYNELMKDPKAFFQLAKDHMEATGEYPVSPLLSSALDIRVADRFARGFLTSPQGILAMKGELIVGALIPKYGVVELNRMHPIAAHFGIQFIPKYPRQKEVSVAGALAVDSITRVEFRDVIVKSVGENTGMSIAGDDTVITGRRVLERDSEDPSLIKLTKFDGEDKVVETSVYKIVMQNGKPITVPVSSK